jgi:hypothetical protein
MVSTGARYPEKTEKRTLVMGERSEAISCVGLTLDKNNTHDRATKFTISSIHPTQETTERNEEGVIERLKRGNQSLHRRRGWGVCA